MKAAGCDKVRVEPGEDSGQESQTAQCCSWLVLAQDSCVLRELHLAMPFQPLKVEVGVSEEVLSSL